MCAGNTQTDKLNIAQREEVKGLPKRFSRQKSALDGFCLVIFREEVYHGVILASDAIKEDNLKRRFKDLSICDSDIILRVNLDTRLLRITETLHTSDGHTRHYRLDLEICVNAQDLRSFAQQYLQGCDPVERARKAIETYLHDYATHKTYNDLREDMLRGYAEQALKENPNCSYGIEVIAALRIILS